MSDQPSHNSPELSPQAAAALDKLVDANWDANDQDTQTLLDALSVLDTPHPTPTPFVVEHTIATMRATDAEKHTPDTPRLSADDAEALDALAMSGFDHNAVPRALKRRAAKLSSLGAILTQTASPEPAADLTDRTMRLIREHARPVADAPVAKLNPRAFRWSDIGAIAAMLVIGVSVLIPTLSTSRDTARREACAAGLQAAGFGFGSYASSNDDLLPMLNPGRPGAVWWNVGQPEQSNSANLYTLARTGYTSLEDLACPSNSLAPRVITSSPDKDWRTHNEVSYSYRILFAETRPTLSDDRFVLLADRSPVIPRARAGMPVNPLENSPNHAGLGQNVLFNDGSRAWLQTPTLRTPSGDDNIWLPNIIERTIDAIKNPERQPALLGIETPDSKTDDFLGP